MPRLRILHCGLLLAGCSSALLGAGCAGTRPELSDTIEGSFIRAAQTWDLNHDGKVTCEEWRTYAASLFKEADSDHDGTLTREEFAKLPKIDRLFEVANFDYYDVNKQGYVNQADFVDRPNPAFAALHHDKSCVINSYQLRASEEARTKGECDALYPDITQVLSRLNCMDAKVRKSAEEQESNCPFPPLARRQAGGYASEGFLRFPSPGKVTETEKAPVVAD
jgi:Ca2+-binding EF-hand superfamily protein